MKYEITAVGECDAYFPIQHLLVGKIVDSDSHMSSFGTIRGPVEFTEPFNDGDCIVTSSYFAEVFVKEIEE